MTNMFAFLVTLNYLLKFSLFCKSVVFGTYEESHDVTRCVMLNGVPMVGAVEGFIHQQPAEGVAPAGGVGCNLGTTTTCNWGKKGGNFTPQW